MDYDKLNCYIDKNAEWLFNLYLRLLMDEGLFEYEDDSEYAPKGCVSFLTIHQSKGMEFPIVFVDSLYKTPRKTRMDILEAIEATYFRRPAFEPSDQIKYFDFWRLYYTAFSRTQDLLVLTCFEDKKTPSKYFRKVYDGLPSADSEAFDASKFSFREVKDVNLKDSFSFTSDVTVYETCSLQYKFFKELEFAPVQVNAMLFGALVHQTIEDIHRAVLRGDKAQVCENNISEWFAANYASLSKSKRAYLAKPQQDVALAQILRYADRQADKWSAVLQAEVGVSLVKPDYIIEGKIDLIRGEGDTVELVDFKAEKKPDLHSEKDKEALERHRRQLHVYAHLIEERTGQKVSKLHIHYTGEENSVPTISFPTQKTAIEGTIMAFDDTVKIVLFLTYLIPICIPHSSECKLGMRRREPTPASF